MATQPDSSQNIPFSLGQIVERTLPNGQTIRVSLGDVNKDGHIDQDDLDVLQMLTGDSYMSEFLMERLSLEELAACDINGDGTISHADMVILCNQVLAQMEMVAMCDELTGLLNRRGLKEKAYFKLRAAKKFASDLTCIAIDIDYFKKINDTYGHDDGDRVLCHVSKLMETCVRNNDILARYGGEEFVILLDQTDAEGAATVAEKLRALIEGSPLKTDEHAISLTISLGLAQYDSSMTLQSLITVADEALYVAKESGRNQYRIYGR